MSITSYPYRGKDDLFQIQAATASWIKQAGFRGYLNVSDIALRLFAGMREYDPGDIIRIWSDTDTGIIGWVMVYPAWRRYEVALHPDYRDHRVSAELLDWAEAQITHHLLRQTPDDMHITLHVFDGDTVYSSQLEQRGYVRGKQVSVISTRQLSGVIPAPQLPDGFSIRSVAGGHELDNLVTHVNSSFGWDLTVTAYGKMMRSPGCTLDNQRVVVAPDGRFVASCIMLPDAYNHMGMFENVATSPDFRRMGLAKALLYDGMRQMQRQHFTVVMVPHLITLGAALALYTSLGLQPTYPIIQYSKSVIP